MTTRILTLALLVPLIAAATSPGVAGASSGRPLRALESIDRNPAPLDTAVFAGGCFWGVEGVFEQLKGVTLSESGYSGGKTASPTYEDVSTGNTGHAEVVRVIYDPAVISYAQLLHVFFSVVRDPTQLNRQGPDVGTHYRSAIFYKSPVQKSMAEQYIAQLTAGKAFSRPIVTEVSPLRAFHRAEEYHQDYMVKHPNQPYIVIHDAPKIENLRRQFPGLLRRS